MEYKFIFPLVWQILHSLHAERHSNQLFRLYLSLDDGLVIAHNLDVRPLQFPDVADSDASEAGKQESPLHFGILTLDRNHVCYLLHLFHSQTVLGRANFGYALVLLDQVEGIHLDIPFGNGSVEHGNETLLIRHHCSLRQFAFLLGLPVAHIHQEPQHLTSAKSIDSYLLLPDLGEKPIQDRAKEVQMVIHGL